MNKTAIRTALVVATAAAMTTGSTILTAAAKDTETSNSNVTVRGKARLYFPAPDDVIKFTVNAHAENADDGAPGRAWGTARMSHRRGPLNSWGKIAVDCVVTGGPVATITGIVIDASPDNQDSLGTRIGFSVYDDSEGHDRVGYTGPRQPDDPPLRKCVATAPTFAVVDGGYTVEGP